jgi:ketosteroid isomerase-like protein
MSQENIETIRTAFEALSRRDVDGWLEAAHADAELHDFPARPGIAHGHDELKAWAEAALEVAAEWNIDPVEFIESEDGRLFVRMHVTGRSAGAGIPVDQFAYTVFEFRGAKVASANAFFDRREALEAAGLSESE